MYTIVLPRTESDLDGIACAVGYAEFLMISNIAAKPWYKELPDAEAQYSINLFPSVEYAQIEDVLTSKKFVLVDTSDLEGLPSEVMPLNVIEVIDHRFHSDAGNLFPNAKIEIEKVGAAATLIVEKFINMNLVPSTPSGLLLYGAIQSNTLCLKGSITSERDKLASMWLENNIPIPDNYLTAQFNARKKALLSDVGNSIKQERKIYKLSGYGEYAVSQLEFHGSIQYLRENLVEIKTILNYLSPTSILNIVDLETNQSCLLVPDCYFKEILKSKMPIKFNSDIAIFEPSILRKQIVESLQNNN